jgi:hexosaminidase
MRISGAICLLGLVLLVRPGLATPHLDAATDLRLVPFPKEVQLGPERFPLGRRLILEVCQSEAPTLVEQINHELELAGFNPPKVHAIRTPAYVVRLSTKARWNIKKPSPTAVRHPDEYELQVAPNAVTVQASGAAGLFYGVQTLRQLIRANRQDDALPGVSIRDWPVLSWRAFQDDLTRGPSSTLRNLEEQAGLGAFLKLNVFTYYMEHQFAFKKYPLIGPKEGSLTPEDLRALVDSSTPLHLNILGNQQSFGHFSAILAHPEFAGLRETPYLLSPTNEKSYELLNDLYSEVAPLLPFPYFNVCCDETDGLGEGPSRPLADRIGTGALYVQHIRRVHDLVTNQYHKRMLMWGDIILRHPDQINRIPKDTILLTWGYDPRGSYEDQILPISKAGCQFLVCPGVNNWNRLLPKFGAATTNIQNFVRDGLQQGALGMLNTAWDDDGETFNAPNWHGFAWGAECAWNGSTTSARDFNHRIGAVLFGDGGDSFGEAIEALSSSESDGLPSAAFWKFDFSPVRTRSAQTALAHWQDLLRPVRFAIANLEACQRHATVNRDLLEYFLFGARRIDFSYQREIDRLEAALTYRAARRAPLAQATPLLRQAEALLQSSRNNLELMARHYADLWLCENRPYALNRVLDRFHSLLAVYDEELQRLAQARLNAKPDRSLPTPREAGLELIEE